MGQGRHTPRSISDPVYPRRYTMLITRVPTNFGIKIQGLFKDFQEP